MQEKSGRISDSLVSSIVAILSLESNLTVREIVDRLPSERSAVGEKTLKSAVNGTLYREGRRFTSNGAKKPRWSLKADRAPRVNVPADPKRRVRSNPATSSLDLYEWQTEALEAWRRTDCRGVIEAVTGTGKTRIGIAAAMTTAGAGGNVLVIVPTVELLRQWHRELRVWLPNFRIGLYGDGMQATWGSAEIIISVVNSARGAAFGKPRANSLLVADECHRYGSMENAKALDERFDQRLGLSATYARNDGGTDRYLDPYFGDTCFRMGYRRAIDDDVTARFKVALIAVPFDPNDRAAYDKANRAAYDSQQWLTLRGGLTTEPFGTFMTDVAKLAEGGPSRSATMHARTFLKNFTERRRILAESPTKLAYLPALMPAFAGADRSILFTQTVAGAEDAAERLRVNGLHASSAHSKLDRDERRQLMSQFETGQLKAIAAPLVLDEGIDVPAADLAVILAASKTQRQMIQRMGRVLRRKPDGRLARFAILFIEDSSEDPANGAHGDFLDEITAVADDVETFPVDHDPADVCAYLNDFDRPAASPTSTTASRAPAIPPNLTKKRLQDLLRRAGQSADKSVVDRLYPALCRLGEHSDRAFLHALQLSAQPDVVAREIQKHSAKEQRMRDSVAGNAEASAHPAPPLSTRTNDTVGGRHAPLRPKHTAKRQRQDAALRSAASTAGIPVNIAQEALHGQGNDQTRAASLGITVESLRAFRAAYNAALKAIAPLESPKQPTQPPQTTAKKLRRTTGMRVPAASRICQSCGHVIRDDSLCGCS